jgi:ATP phosphoribosyltransferase
MSDTLKMVIPKGRLQDKVEELLARIGIELTFSTRSYRPVCSDPDIEVKLLKPQNIPALITLGRHDCGFTGLDWIIEQDLLDDPNLVELVDLGYNKVRIVAAMPEDLAADRENLLKNKRLVVASEYHKIAADYIQKKNLNAVLIKSYGATEALPPEDADMIIDNTSTGSTLEMNRLVIIDEILTSTTRVICSQEALNDPAKREKLQQMQMLINSARTADQKVLLEMNVPSEKFEELVNQLPSMRSPTVSPLYKEKGFAVKIAVPAKEVPQLIPRLVRLGATDILEYRLEKIVP